MKSSTRPAPWLPPKSALAGIRFPSEVIVVAVRWQLRCNVPYRDVEELLVEGSAEVDDVTVYRWVQRFTPLLADATRFSRHSPGDRWFVDEMYVKVNGVWLYVYREVDQYGQVIDVLVSARWDADAARRFFRRALSMLNVTPVSWKRSTSRTLRCRRGSDRVAAEGLTRASGAGTSAGLREVDRARPIRCCRCPAEIGGAGWEQLAPFLRRHRRVRAVGGRCRVRIGGGL